jgi:hypothetical protein
METIKEAVIGKRGQYCNGIEQFAGYLSDMGNLPDLYYYDDEQERLVKVTRAGTLGLEAVEGAGGLTEALKQGYRPQPRTLWTKTEATPDWKYHEQSRMWAGWRGPYMELQGEGSLKDAWGNDFIFVIGEVVGHRNPNEEIGSTFRCKQTYKAQLDPEDPTDSSTPADQGRPGTVAGDDYWEVIWDGEEMNFRTWRDLGTASNADGSEHVFEDDRWQTKQEIFYGTGCLTVISLGADNAPGGEGLDQDIQIVIDPTEYTGEAAGHLGYRGQEETSLPREVCLYCPNFTAEGGMIEEHCLKGLKDNSKRVLWESSGTLYTAEDPYDSGDLYAGINFRFGAVPAYEVDLKGWSCTCDDGNGDCTCVEWKEEGECKTYRCQFPYAFDPRLCSTAYPLDQHAVCSVCEQRAYDEDDDRDWQGWEDNWGWILVYFGLIPLPSEPWCVEAICSEEVKCDPGGMWWESITCECIEWEPICITWLCDEENPDCDCTQTWEKEVEEDPENFEETAIPIGIRTLKAGAVYYTVPISPGGNWVGTIRGK